ncbi:MAG: nitrous oxide reductase accessory protein NosL [Bacillus sp. (in: firmicutes)]
MKKVISLLVIIWMVGILAACGEEQSYEPEEINPDVDVCEICNMSLSDNTFATQIISKEGVSYKFDDIGCMMEYIQKDQRIAEEDIAKQYVRDTYSSNWIEIENAYFVYDEDVWTPMSYGVISFESKEEADKYVKEEGGGEVYDYTQLLKHEWGWES